MESSKLKFALIISVALWSLLLIGLCDLAQAMPSQVLIIRHAEKFEDRRKINLNPRGKTRAEALSQFFQSDPRVLKHGVVSAIIAQTPNDLKKSVRCEETVEPLARAIGQDIVNKFRYGEINQLVEFVKTRSEWDSKSVLICAQHIDIVPLATSFGVENIRQSVWPHETYDRVWILDFSPPDGKLISFKDIPQCLLFGDSFQSAEEVSKSGSVRFVQSYAELSTVSDKKEKPYTNWKCKIVAQIPGDFSEFDDETIPMLRLGGFTFGYHATSLGKLKRSPNAEVNLDPDTGRGSFKYYYRAIVNGIEQNYGRVYFDWNREWLKIEFDASVDESIIKADLNMPVECHMERFDGLVNGITNCCVAFGPKRFNAPAGLSYSGIASRIKDPSGSEAYYISLRDDNGFIIRKTYMPEL